MPSVHCVFFFIFIKLFITFSLMEYGITIPQYELISYFKNNADFFLKEEIIEFLMS